MILILKLDRKATEADNLKHERGFEELELARSNRTDPEHIPKGMDKNLLKCFIFYQTYVHCRDEQCLCNNEISYDCTVFY